MRIGASSPEQQYAEGFFAPKVLLDLAGEVSRGMTDADAEAAAPGSRFDRSVAAQARLHELVPGGSHTYARGSDQYPDGHGARPGARCGSPGRGPGRQRLRRVRHGAALGDPRARVRARGRGGLPDDCAGDELQPPCRDRAAGGGDLPATGARRRHGEVRQERLRRHDRGGQARPGPPPGRRYVAICRTQPFFSTDDWFIGTTPMRAGILEEEHWTDRLRLQRPGARCRRCWPSTRATWRASCSRPPPPWQSRPPASSRASVGWRTRTASCSSSTR